MSDAGQAVDERRARTHDMVARLTAQRMRMWVLYCQVAGVEPFSAEKPRRELLREFCQLLIDYIAQAHFVMYERIASGRERRRTVADLAAKFYPRIVDSTEVAVDFNDRYASGKGEASQDLAADLSHLGEALALRIELEDRLLAALA